MIKGNQLLLLALLLLIIAGVASYLYFGKTDKEYLPAAFALPESSVLVYSSSGFADTGVSARYINYLGNALPEISAEYKYFYGLFDSISSLEVSEVGPVIFSIQIPAPGRRELLVLYQSGDRLKQSELKNIFEKRLSAKIWKHSYNEHNIYEVKDDAKQNLFAYALVDGIFILSRNTVIVEDAVSAYKANLQKDNEFVKKITAQVQTGKFYINYKLMPTLLNIFAQNKYAGNVARTADLALNGEYEFSSGKNYFSFNGILNTVEDNSWHFMQKLAPQQMELYTVLPIKTTYFIGWAAESVRSFYQYRSGISSNNGADPVLENNLDLEMDILNWMGSEWGYAEFDPKGLNEASIPVMVIKTPDTVGAMERLREVNGRIISEEPYAVASEIYRNFTIEQIGLNNVFDQVLGPIFDTFDRPFYTQLGEYLVFVPSVEDMRPLIDAYVDDQTLDRNKEFNSLNENLASESNFLLYINPERSTGLLNRFLRPQVSLRDFARNFGGMAYQVTSNRTSIYNQIVISTERSEDANVELLWSLSLEENITGKPHVVSQNASEQKEILVQDQGDNLCLVSNTGSLKWKKQLEGRIQGDVYQIDLYKSGELQYLFATSTKVYLIDHDGLDVGNYPLRLAAPTETGIMLLENDETREYKYFVGTVNRKVYGFQANGKPVPGWAPVSVSSNLLLPLKYFITKGEIYLFGLTQSGKFYVWRENGNTLFQPFSLETSFTSPFTIAYGSTFENSYLYSVDTSGALYKIYLSGDIQQSRLATVTSAPFFNYENIDESGGNEIILSFDSAVNVYRYSSLFRKFNTATPIRNIPQLFGVQGRSLIGYYSATDSRYYLYNFEGDLQKGFPVEGTTDIGIEDMNADESMELVIGNGKTLYLYNIRVN